MIYLSKFVNNVPFDCYKMLMTFLKNFADNHSDMLKKVAAAYAL